MDKTKDTEGSVSALAEIDIGIAGGKFLTFILAGEEYGLEILKVQEIMGVLNVTPVPRTPKFVKGVINLRGKIIPVVDLRLKFSMEEAGHTEETCIIVVDIENDGDTITMGTIVDKVSEVIDIRTEQVEEVPDFGIDLDTRFILGIGKIDDKVVIILDVDKVLTASETNLVVGMSKADECPLKD